MFNLENAIQNWKRSLKRNPSFETGQVKEMETHLRDEIDELIASGLTEEEAFNRTVMKFGPVEEIGDEVYKTKSTGPDATPPWKQSSWIPDMLPNYTKVAIRNIKNDKLYSSINILGLAIGMACFILIGWYILHETNYDKNYPGAGQIYRITVDVKAENRTDRFASSAPPMGPTLKAVFPGVDQYARLRIGNTQMVQHDEHRFYESNIIYADSTFFDIFRLPFREGNPARALQVPNSVILSYALAQKYFPGETAMGKTLTFSGSQQYTVTGVLAQDQPLMHLDLEIILPFKNFVQSYPEGPYEDWGWVSFYNYIRVNEGTSISDLERKLPGLLKQHAGDAADRISLHLQPVRDIHLSPGRMGEIGATTNQSYIYILGLAALFTLGISVFNFMNLASARSMKRGLEIGIRKVVGAHRLQLAGQHLGESIFQALIALVVSILLIEGFLRLPGETLLTGLTSISPFYREYLPAILVVAVLTGIFAGLYPSLVLSRLNAADAVKNRFTRGNKGGQIRNTLIILQFTVTVILITGTLVVIKQLDFLRSKDLGFDKEQVLVVPLNSEDVRQQFEPMKNELTARSEIDGITAGRLALDGDYGTVTFRAEEHSGESIRMRLYPVYFGFTEVLGMDLSEGRGFSESFPADTSHGFIINEAAARMLDWESEAVGKQLQATNYATGRRQVVGVVKDFHYTPLHEEVVPLVLFVRNSDMHFMYVRLAPNAVTNGLEQVKEVWNRRLPEYPFDYWFLDDRLDSQYKTEEQFAHLVNIFSVIAIGIACFGLFGIASFSTEQRRKEIGIRKVHGATVPEIIWMVTANFMKPVLVSFLIAVPAAYYWANQWLENFAYRIEISIGIFLLSGAFVLLLSVLTVSGQAIRAASVNPVKSLHAE